MQKNPLINEGKFKLFKIQITHSVDISEVKHSDSNTSQTAHFYLV